jgi:outer membrane protein assembly factor BamB
MIHSKYGRNVLFLLAMLTLVAPLAAAEYEVDPLDWPTWRGPQQNSTSTETGLIESWDPKGGPGSNLLWKREDLGGRSSPIVMRGKVYLLTRDKPGTDQEGEKVVCLNAVDGTTVWEHRFNVYLSDVPDTRVGWSCCEGDPTTGRVYAQGVAGNFYCLEGDTGEVVWEKSLHEEFGLLSTYGGRTNVPRVFEDLVIASAVVIGWDEMAKPAHRFMAFDKATGEMVWFNGTRLIPYDTTYSTPTLTVLGGQAAVVFGSGDGQIWAIQPRTGAHIWNYPFSRRGLNVSPLVDGDMVYSGHSEENLSGTTQGAMVAIDGTGKGDLAGKEKWQDEELMVGKSSPLMIDGKLWVVDDRAKLLMLDPANGEVIARKALGTAQRSTPIYADGKVYTCTANGRWYILRPTDSGAEFVHRLRLNGQASDGSPAISHGRIYLPLSGGLYCLGQENQQVAAGPAPAAPQETPVADDQTPAHVQLVPCEVLLKPGDKQVFKVRLFNSRGQFLKETEGEFSVNGPGEIAAGGEYTASTADGHVAAFVTCKVGDLAGSARVRIVPPLPWSFDFSGEDIPITWVGGRVRHVVREVDGERVAVKRNVLPAGPGKTTKLGTRSRCWFGPTDLSDYTIQADVQGQTFEDKMPDIGLMNQRYTMTLFGASQELQIGSWETHDKRSQQTVSFPWKPGQWYTMKMTSHVKDGKAIVRGKVWPRGETEPAEWTLEVIDEAPNAAGSPGLFGNAKDAEFYLDNIQVAPNDG